MRLIVERLKTHMVNFCHEPVFLLFAKRPHFTGKSLNAPVFGWGLSQRLGMNGSWEFGGRSHHGFSLRKKLRP